MKRLFLSLGLLFTSPLSAGALEDEDRIRTWVRLKTTIAEMEFCSNELNKLESLTETPFVFDQNNPADSNRRFSDDTLTSEERVAYDELATYCLDVFVRADALSKEYAGSSR